MVVGDDASGETASPRSRKETVVNRVERPRPASQNQLNAYVESWHADHRAAMQSADWADMIAVGLSVYTLLRGRDQSRRARIFRGLSPFSTEDDALHRDSLSVWLNTTRAALLERDRETVDGADELRARVVEATESLANWTQPTISSALGLRELQLDDAAATAFDRILANAKVHPTPMPSGQPMQESSLENFRSRPKSA